MSLSEDEQKKLVELMEKVNFPTPLPIFEAWCKTFGILCAEVIVKRNNNGAEEIFLVNREDKFFSGWHIPGCVHLPSEGINETLNRVLEKEVLMKVDKPIFYNWFERMHGENDGQSKRGYEFSLVFTVNVLGECRESENEKFFPVSNLPSNIVKGHIPIMEQYINEYQE